MSHTLIGMIIACVLLIAAIIAFFSLYKQRRQYLRLKAVLDLAISKNGLALTRHEIVGDRLLAWYQADQLLLVVEPGHTEPLMIDLKAANKCYVIKKADRRTVKVIRMLFATKHNRVVYDLILYKQYQERTGSHRKVERQCRHWRELLNSQLLK